MKRGKISVTVVVAAGLVTSLLSAQTVQVADLALDSGFQDSWFGHFKRGRTAVAADFDLDGRVDFYIGSPTDESFVIRNVTGEDGAIEFEFVQLLVSGVMSWGGAAADYDNDGDYDLFVANGGIEGIGLDYLFKNMWVENGGTALVFTDVGDTAGIRGPVPPGETEPIPIASANAVWGDYDRDGNIDLFVNGNIHNTSLAELRGRNVLWRNNGDGTFADVTDAMGLGGTSGATQHSTFLDIDNDGDLDLFENNSDGQNVLWRNRLVESGTANFEDVTQAFSPAPDEDLGYPEYSFASAAVDLDQDGWQDLVVFMRGGVPEAGSPYVPGHAVFMNQGGTSFENAADLTGINDTFQTELGVMGCQVGDVNADGVPDIFVGSGGPPAGNFNRLYLSDSAVGVLPHYTDRTDLIDFPAPEDPGSPIDYPPYPYRTHGTSLIDLNGDGSLEVAVTNGGPGAKPDFVQEPNRLFEFDWSPQPAFFKVRPVGNGTSVSRDAVGTRFALTVRRNATVWTLRNTLLAGSAFSAQNGFDVFFGLGDADTVESLEILWPDGASEVVDDGLSVNSSIVVLRDSEAGSVPAALTVAKEQGGSVTLDWEGSCAAGDIDFAVYEGTLGGDFTDHAPRLCTTGGETTATLPSAGGSVYFLVVPRNHQSEGSYGQRADQAERPAAASPCLPQQTGACL